MTTPVLTTTTPAEGWEKVQNHDEVAYQEFLNAVFRITSVIIQTDDEYVLNSIWAFRTQIDENTRSVARVAKKMVWKTIVVTEITPAYEDGAYCNQIPTPENHLESEIKKITSRPQYVVGSLTFVAGWCGDGGDYYSNSTRLVWAEVAE